MENENKCGLYLENLKAEIFFFNKTFTLNIMLKRMYYFTYKIVPLILCLFTL